MDETLIMIQARVESDGTRDRAEKLRREVLKRKVAKSCDRGKGKGRHTEQGGGIGSGGGDGGGVR